MLILSESESSLLGRRPETDDTDVAAPLRRGLPTTALGSLADLVVVYFLKWIRRVEALSPIEKLRDERFPPAPLPSPSWPSLVDFVES